MQRSRPAHTYAVPWMFVFLPRGLNVAAGEQRGNEQGMVVDVGRGIAAALPIHPVGRPCPGNAAGRVYRDALLLSKITGPVVRVTRGHLVFVLWDVGRSDERALGQRSPRPCFPDPGSPHACRLRRGTPRELCAQPGDVQAAASSAESQPKSVARRAPASYTMPPASTGGACSVILCRHAATVGRRAWR
jgi:hypothetical protein